jgi:hypothetical protein
MACPECEEMGCEHCKETGQIRITTCPHSEIVDLQQFFPLADLFKEGVPPIAGGALDQAQWFLTASRQLKCDESVFLAELNNG